MLYVHGNNCDTDDTEYYVAILRGLDGDTNTLLYYRSKPHHDGCIMMGCDADGTVSDKITAWIAQRASIFYVTSFWKRKLFRTSGF